MKTISEIQKEINVHLNTISVCNESIAALEASIEAANSVKKKAQDQMDALTWVIEN